MLNDICPRKNIIIMKPRVDIHLVLLANCMKPVIDACGLEQRHHNDIQIMDCTYLHQQCFSSYCPHVGLWSHMKR